MRESWNVIRTLAEASAPSAKIVSLAGKLSYLLGNYDMAERFFRRIIDDKEHGAFSLNNHAHLLPAKPV